MKHIASLAKRVLGISFMSLLNMTSLWAYLLSLWKALTRAVSVFYVTTWWRYGRLRRCPVTWCEPQQRQIWEFSTRTLNLFDSTPLHCETFHWLHFKQGGLKMLSNFPCTFWKISLIWPSWILSQGDPTAHNWWAQNAYSWQISCLATLRTFLMWPR